MVRAVTSLPRARRATQATERIAKSLPVGVTLSNMQNQPKAVADSVSEFLQVLIEAVVVVLAVSFSEPGPAQAPGSSIRCGSVGISIRAPGLVVGITIPLVLAATFLAMWYWNIGLHKVSLGSPSLRWPAGGRDAIIAVEMMVRKMEEVATTGTVPPPLPMKSPPSPC